MDDIKKLLDDKFEKQEEERGAKRWEPEPGDTLSGVIMKVGWYDSGEYEPSMFLIFKDVTEHETYRVWVKTVLANQLNEEAPAIGQLMAIRYDGKVEGQTGRAYHNYTVVLVPDNKGEVKRDFPFWLQHGTYTGATKVQRRIEAANADDDERFF
jgi:hypothetical protein